MIKLLLTIIFIVSSLVGGFYVVYPSYAEYQIKIKEGEILYEELENMMVYVAQLKEIERKIYGNKEDLYKIKKALPEDHDTPSFFMYLKEKIKEHGLENEGNLGGFNVRAYETDKTQHARIKEVSFTLEVSGRYNDVKGFFEDIEKLMRIISINNINISSSLPSEGFVSPRGRDILGISFSGSTYSY